MLFMPLGLFHNYYNCYRKHHVRVRKSAATLLATIHNVQRTNCSAKQIQCSLWLCHPGQQTSMWATWHMHEAWRSTIIMYWQKDNQQVRCCHTVSNSESNDSCNWHACSAFHMCSFSNIPRRPWLHIRICNMISCTDTAMSSRVSAQHAI